MAAHLLIIEDDAALVDLYKHLCAEWGFTCDAVVEGFHGLDKFRKGRYDTVLLDLELPDVKGDNLAREFLKKKPAPPIIVITGHGTAERAHRLAREGVYQFIQKPFRNEELLEAIQSALRRWRLVKAGVTEHELFELRELALLMRDESSRFEVLQSLLNSAVRLTSASSGSIMLWEPVDRCLVVEVVKNLPSEALGSRVPLGGRISGKVLEEGKPILIAGAAQENPRYSRTEGRPEVKCSLCVPAFAHGTPIGVLNLNSTISEDFFSPHDLEVAAIFADDAANFLAQFDLTDQLRQKVGALEQTQTSLQRVSEHLAMSEKMSSVGTLAGGIAHQFNNLLAIIQSNLEMISLGMVDQKVGIQKSLDASKRAAEVAAGMLTFARNMRRTERVELSLTDTLKRLVLVTGKEFEASHLRVITDLPPEPLSVNAAPGEIQEIFMNLLMNARDAMEREGEVRLIGRREAAGIVVQVHDNGRGIPEENAKQIFDPFFTTKPDGTGLGLWRVYNLVKGLGGSIDVESRPGAGTCFTLRLPSAPVEAQDAQSSHARR